MVSPDNLLEESRPAGAVLHGLFEWDDTVAAEKFRAEQARTCVVHITCSGEAYKTAGRIQ